MKHSGQLPKPSCWHPYFCIFSAISDYVQTRWMLHFFYFLNLKFSRWCLVLRPVAQLYGQVRTDWNQCFAIDCSLRHPAGHKPFTCSHSVLRNTWLNIHAVRWMRFSSHLSVYVFTISQNLTCCFSSVVPWASCRLPDSLTVFCDMIAAVSSWKTSRCLC